MVDTSTYRKNEYTLVHRLKIHQATLYVVYARLQAFHWNVTGPHFFEYHEVLGGMYETIGQYIDQIAERILMCGGHPLTTLSEYLKYSEVDELDVAPMKVREIASYVLKDLDVLVTQLHDAIFEATEQGDDGTVDLLSGMLRAHEKQQYLWSGVTV